MIKNRFAFGRVLLAGMFVVPESQLYILDVPWQLYTFQVFHRSGINRLVHAAGIVAITASLYAMLDHLWSAGALGAALLCALHLMLAYRASLLRLAPLLIAVHALLCFTGRACLLPLSAATGLGVANSLAAVIAGAASLQVLGHVPEPSFPPPISGTDGWVRSRDWFRGLTLRRAVWLLLIPCHAFVEAWSAPRNLFLLVALAVEQGGLASQAWLALSTRVDAVVRSPSPPLVRAELHAALCRS